MQHNRQRLGLQGKRAHRVSNKTHSRTIQPLPSQAAEEYDQTLTDAMLSLQGRLHGVTSSRLHLFTIDCLLIDYSIQLVTACTWSTAYTFLQRYSSSIHNKNVATPAFSDQVVLPSRKSLEKAAESISVASLPPKAAKAANVSFSVGIFLRWKRKGDRWDWRGVR